MIIIAESGSTKTNWVAENNKSFETIGFNPMFHNSEFIFNELMKQQELLQTKDLYTEIYFYGASCSSADRNKTVSDALSRYFTKTTLIKVDHDLKAAAVATYDGRTGIACILGTGSNSCLYDGKEITEVVPALGYVLGDEGGGAYFGKKLLSGYLYHELPEATTKILEEQYKVEKEKILDHVYKQPSANVYLATFAKVMQQSPDKEFMHQLAIEGFTDFFKHHVCCYKNYKLYPVHFVGSIAFYMKDALQVVANNFGCELGTIVHAPVHRLLEWHLKQR